MKVLLYDNTQGYLTFFWSLGRFLSKWDAVISASSWDNAIDQMALLGPIRELQFWGHGSAGQPFINGEALDDKLTRFAAMGRFHKFTDSVIWWRACDVFSRIRGAQFAIDAVQMTQCAHVGHTRVISWPWPIFQSGGYTIKVGQPVYWDPLEGVSLDNESKGSHPFVHHTCFVLKMSVPKRWWKQE